MSTTLQQQPYDNVLKSLFEGHEQEMLPVFLKDAKFVEALNVEVLRTPLRVDRVYKIEYEDTDAVLDLEFESGGDGKIASRLLSYHAYHLDKFDLPVFTVVVYLFPTSLAQSPFEEKCGKKKILKFYFRQLSLWKLNANYFVRRHIVSMYALLPTMQGANRDMLLSAIDELAKYYVGNDVQLAHHLKWLGVMLRRSETIPLDDKESVQERLDMWNSLLEQDEYLQKFIARRAEKKAEEIAEKKVEKAVGKAQEQGIQQGMQQGMQQGIEKGKALGETEGELKASRSFVLDIVAARFPSLTEMAKRRVQKIDKPANLRQIATGIAVAPDEKTALQALMSDVG